MNRRRRLQFLLAVSGAYQVQGGCPGSIDVVGHGTVSLVTAEFDKRDVKAGNVELIDGRVVYPQQRSRSYFASSCEDGRYNHTQYASLKLLGKTLKYTVDLSEAGCGCNAGLTLTSMRQNDNPSDCGDYYCDANQVCGVACDELDLQQANMHAWHSTLKARDDGTGAKCGLGGDAGMYGTCMWDSKDYGPKARCIDTRAPFQVAISFHSTNGSLSAMEVQLTQDGSPCPLKLNLDRYDVLGDKTRNGLAELSVSLAKGMTPIISYWSSDDLLWLDGSRKGRPACSRDKPDVCPKSIQFFDFAVEDIKQEKACPEICPVGRCDRDSDGVCKWFGGKDFAKVKAYHCKVASCDDVPKGSSLSRCWTWKGEHYYSIKHRQYPCPELTSTTVAAREGEDIQEEIVETANMLMRWTTRPRLFSKSRATAPHPAPLTALGLLALGGLGLVLLVTRRRARPDNRTTLVVAGERYEFVERMEEAEVASAL